MLTFSHRGYHAQFTENTLAAFEAAIVMGADGIETDVRLSRDGHLVLLHNRVTPQGDLVKDLTHSELETCLGHAIPSLEQALQMWAHVRWDIELKVAEVLEGVVQVLRQFPNREHFLVTSFNHALVRRCAEVLEVPTGVLLDCHPLNPSQFFAEITRCPAHLRSIVWGYELLDHNLIAEAAAHGLDNWVFDVRTVEEHQHCKSAVLAGVITDHPQLMR